MAKRGHLQYSIEGISSKDFMTQRLYAITCVSNPLGWASRIRLAKMAISSWIDQGAIVYVVECAHGSRGYDLADIPGIVHIPVRATTMAWAKESLLNIGIHNLPHEAHKIATIDADIIFRDPNWINKTEAALDLYPVVQNWSHAYDLGPGGSHGAVHTSFAHQWLHGQPVTISGSGGWRAPYSYPHSGYSWAWTRTFLDDVGGLFDLGGIGAGDHHGAWSSRQSRGEFPG